MNTPGSSNIGAVDIVHEYEALFNFALFREFMRYVTIDNSGAIAVNKALCTRCQEILSNPDSVASFFEVRHEIKYFINQYFFPRSEPRSTPTIEIWCEYLQNWRCFLALAMMIEHIAQMALTQVPVTDPNKMPMSYAIFAKHIEDAMINWSRATNTINQHATNAKNGFTKFFLGQL